jgi:toxin ParE1/3/4
VSGYRFTETAEADIEDIQAYSLRQFGPVQTAAYGRLIDTAAQMLGESPMRPGSRAREELREGVRSFHLELAAGRRGAASHVLYYVVGPMEDGTSGAVIIRVLWEGMEPGPRVAIGLDDLDPE